MSLCKHNRKAWKCRLCKGEEARNYGVALNDADKGETVSIALADLPVMSNDKINGFTREAARKMVEALAVPGPSLDPVRRPRNHPSEHARMLEQEQYRREFHGETKACRDFEQWLHQYGRYNQAAGRTVRDLIHQDMEELMFPHTLPAKDFTVHVRSNCTINIEHACTIRINGNTFHVRQEGDRMMLLDKSMRRLS